MSEKSADSWKQGYGSESARDSAGIYCTPENGFAELADTYDVRLVGNPLHLLESTEVLSALPDIVGQDVADIGCGTGRYTLQLSRMGAATVTGIDLSAEMLAIAERKAISAELPIKWRIGDLQKELPIVDETFDTALCAVVLSFMSEWEQPFREMARVLKPDGILVISDYHPHSLQRARAASLAVGKKDNAPYIRFTTANGAEYRLQQYPYSISDMFQAAQKAGLELEHIAEPVCDRRLSNTYANLREMIGVPLALIMRFRKK